MFQTRVARGGSFSSVFQSQEDSQTPGTTDTSYPNPSTGMEDVERALQEISHEISMEFSAWSEDPERTESIGTQSPHLIGWTFGFFVILCILCTM